VIFTSNRSKLKQSEPNEEQDQAELNNTNNDTNNGGMLSFLLIGFFIKWNECGVCFSSSSSSSSPWQI